MSEERDPNTCGKGTRFGSEYFPYLRFTTEGSLVIPADKVSDFVRKYLELSDSREHMERLKAYLGGERGSCPVDPGD